jgi:hypothetical protein
MSRNHLSRDFRGRSIFDFCNSILSKADVLELFRFCQLWADFVVEIGVQAARDGWCIFLKPSVATRRIMGATYARLYWALQRLRRARRDDWWWPGDQLGKPAKVLRNRGQRELELGTAWPAQSQPAEP